MTTLKFTREVKILRLMKMGRRFARLEQLVQRKAIEKGAQKEKHFRRVNKFKFKFAGVIESRTDFFNTFLEFS